MHGAWPTVPGTTRHPRGDADVTHDVSRDEALELERIERWAWRDQFDASDAARTHALGLRVTEVDGALVMAADGEDSLLQNRVLGLGLDRPLDDASLAAVLAHYRRGQGFAINLCPFAAPGDAAAWLRRHGFATFFHHLKWTRAGLPATPVDTDLEVVDIGPERAADWARTYAAVHELTPAYAAWSACTVGRPGWTHHLALDGGEPVAASAMYVRDGLAWLGKGGTLSAHRRRGAQGALLAARIRIALARGVRRFAMETAPDWPDLPGGSLRNAARAGFRPAYERPSWILAPGA